MLRAGVSLPALMKMLGHRSANMTLRYVEITQKDLQREFQMARRSPRHLLPEPTAGLPGLSAQLPEPDAIVPDTVVEQVATAIRVMEIFRKLNPAIDSKPLQLLNRRLVRIRSLFQKLVTGANGEK